MEWYTKTDSLIDSRSFKLEFRLKSRPLSDVHLKLDCEGTEIISYSTAQQSGIQELDRTSATAQEALGKIIISPEHWNRRQTFVLGLLDTGNAPTGF